MPGHETTGPEALECWYPRCDNSCGADRSAVGVQPEAALPDYNVTKAAVNKLTVSLAKELANTGVTVNTRERRTLCKHFKQTTSLPIAA